MFCAPQELEKKLQTQARRADHLERARREEEAPLLLAAHEQRLQVTEPPCYAFGMLVSCAAMLRASRWSWSRICWITLAHQCMQPLCQYPGH